ncbi:MAG: hypothetical protein EOO68_09895 [Moraxellaceae bacterium]|nr:MAG: hypothetical protein EOO68_09895 [Moraxellaceae bacterium]
MLDFIRENAAKLLEQTMTHIGLTFGSLLLADSEVPKLYVVPDFNNPNQKKILGANRVVILGDSWLETFANKLAPSVCTQDNSVLVFADDILDPRLLQLNEHFRTENRPWLLIKVTGENPSIGPLFLPNNGPCYACLHTRLVANYPVREWCRRLDGAAMLSPVPVLLPKENIESLVEIWRARINDFCNDNLKHNSLRRFEFGSCTTFSIHNVFKRPQCPSCGDKTLISKLYLQPVKLQKVLAGDDLDGGLRSEDRAKTLEKLSLQISEMTGLISHAKALTSETPGQMVVYQASYFINTFANSSPNQDTFVQLSLGKGISHVQAKISALAESLERQAAQYTGEEPILLSTPGNLSGRAYLPHQLAAFSAAQYDEFAFAGKPNILQPQVVQPYEGQAIHWVAGWSISRDERVYFPASFCLANTPFDDRNYVIYTHNGNSAGASVEEACLQGLLELIERDAVAIWWYNQIPCPEIDINILPAESRRCIDATLGADWDYWLLDVSNDLPAVTCVAVGQKRGAKNLVLGFGCHVNPVVAAQRALSELNQLITVRDKVSGAFNFDAIRLQPFLRPKRAMTKKILSDYNCVSQTSLNDYLFSLLDTLNLLGLDCCVVNYSRPDVPLITLKVIVPGLCHFWPQFACERLYSVPVKLGWFSEALIESEFNPQALYL